FLFFQAEDGIRDATVTGVQTCALPILILARLCWLRCRKKRMAWQLWTPCRFLTSRSNRSRARKRKRRMVRARSISEWLSKRSNEIGRASCRERGQIEEVSGEGTRREDK